jgi:hypothetical protein
MQGRMEPDGNQSPNLFIIYEIPSILRTRVGPECCAELAVQGQASTFNLDAFCGPLVDIEQHPKFHSRLSPPQFFA